MVVGFTGTRQGLTPAQETKVRELLVGLGEIRGAHHGDAVGADARFHEFCLELGVPVYLHPADDPKDRAYCKGARDTSAQRKFLDLNRDIVDWSHVMIATPATMKEQLRSGTWAAVRYARKRGRTIYIVWPDGTVTVEGSQA
jgi:hypothetical protein